MAVFIASSAMNEARSRAMVTPLLEVDNLAVEFVVPQGRVRAVNGLSFCVKAGETLGIVGESGCGKSVTALSLLRLIPSPGRVAAGRMLLEGRDLLTMSEAQMQQIRGAQIAMVFQEPMTSLNPVLTIGRQISETLVRHEGLSRRAARRRAAELLDLVRIVEPQRRLLQYPHELSGGMRQRVVIAMAISCSPKLLVADEPTTALDVSVQAQILDLLNELKRATGMGMILITHDLGVVATTCERVMVMYAGSKVEEATTAELFQRSLHPYTSALMRAMPRLARRQEGAAKPRRLDEIPGAVPSLSGIAPGCRFADRCRHAVAFCRTTDQVVREISPNHFAACWQAERIAAEGDG
jgi:oligopeptide/dipeptide ABC transporter ATP-binding protein